VFSSTAGSGSGSGPGGDYRKLFLAIAKAKNIINKNYIAIFIICE